MFQNDFTHGSRGEQIPQKKNVGVKILSLLLAFSLMLMFSVPAFAATANTDSTNKKLYMWA